MISLYWQERRFDYCILFIFDLMPMKYLSNDAMHITSIAPLHSILLRFRARISGAGRYQWLDNAARGLRSVSSRADNRTARTALPWCASIRSPLVPLYEARSDCECWDQLPLWELHSFSGWLSFHTVIYCHSLPQPPADIIAFKGENDSTSISRAFIKPWSPAPHDICIALSLPMGKHTSL